MRIKKIKKVVINLLGILLSPLIIYGLLVIILGLIRVNRAFKQQEQGVIELFLIGNPIHAGLALPVKHSQRDWWTRFSPNNTLNPALSRIQPYVLIGWGSESFYTKVPKWRDLRVNTAFKALFFDRSVLHITYIDKPQSTHHRSIWLTEKQYQKLVNHIDKDIQLPIRTMAAHYSETDAFYSANGFYSPINTCNDWVRKQLKHAEMTAPFWSPFSYPLFWHAR